MTQDELLQIIEQAAANGATELDLSGSDLTELPPEIGQLTQLEVLVLGKEENGEYIGNKLSCLTTRDSGLLKQFKGATSSPVIGDINISLLKHQATN
jgi:internalin A